MALSRLLVLGLASSLLVIACDAASVAPYQGKSNNSNDESSADDLDEDSPEDPPTTTPKPKPSSPSNRDAGASTTTPTGTASVTAAEVPPAGQCASGAKKSACVACCLASQLGGAQPGANGANAFSDCMCNAGPCASACGASYCQGKVPSSTCNTCLESKALQCSDAATGGGNFTLDTMQCLLTCF